MKRCIHCNKIEEEHCPGFAIRQMPTRCQCDEQSWGDNVTPICGQFVPGGTAGDESYCQTCEHDKRCHAAEQPRKEEK